MPEVTGYRVVSTLQSTRLRSTDWTSEAVVSICSSESASAQFRRNEVLIVTHNMDLFSIKCKLWKELLTERISLWEKKWVLKNAQALVPASNIEPVTRLKVFRGTSDMLQDRARAHSLSAKTRPLLFPIQPCPFLCLPASLFFIIHAPDEKHFYHMYNRPTTCWVNSWKLSEC